MTQTPTPLSMELERLCSEYTATALPRPARAVAIAENVILNLPAILAALSQAPSCRHEPYQGRCVHCDIPFLHGQPYHGDPPAASTNQVAIPDVEAVDWSAISKGARIVTGKADFEMAEKVIENWCVKGDNRTKRQLIAEGVALARAGILAMPQGEKVGPLYPNGLKSADPGK